MGYQATTGFHASLDAINSHFDSFQGENNLAEFSLSLGDMPIKNHFTSTCTSYNFHLFF